MNELERKFQAALDEWEETGDRVPMIELLKPFADAEGLYILESDQKGYGCGWIEIQDHLIAPMHDIESGCAIMFLAQWLRKEGGDSMVIYFGNGCDVSVFKKGRNVPSRTQNPSLAIAMLWLVVSKYAPKEPGE